MSENALTVFDPNNVAIPAHILEAQGELGTNITERGSVPSLSYEGKVWAISLDGNKTKLTRPNADGDQEPVPIMKAVIVDYADRRGRAYHEGSYDPTKTAAPVCWSADGLAPAASVPLETKQTKTSTTTCAECPMSVKGSRVSDNGKATAACGQHRMLALVPGWKVDFTPLRLRIAITSDYDKEVVEIGWYAWQQYTDYLKSRGILNTALVVTKIKFDQNESYPKLLFAVDRYTSPEETSYLKTIAGTDDVKKLITETWGVPNAGGPAAQLPDQRTTTGPAPATTAASNPAPATPASEQVIEADYAPQLPDTTAAPAPPADEPAPPPPVETQEVYVMAAGEKYTREQYNKSGWTDEKLLSTGKMTKQIVEVAATTAPAPTPEPAPVATASVAAAAAPTTPAATANSATAAAGAAKAVPADVAALLGDWTS